MSKPVHKNAILMRGAARLVLLRPHDDVHPVWDTMYYRWTAAVGRGQNQMRTSIRDSIHPKGAERWFPA